MTKACYKKAGSYIFSLLEIIVLLLMLLSSKKFSLVVSSIQIALILYAAMVFGIIVLEIVYFIRLIKSKIVFAGFPLQMISVFKCEILETHFSYSTGVTYSLMLIFGIITVLRIVEAVYLYRNQNSAKGLPWGVFLAASVSDIGTFITKFLC